MKEFLKRLHYLFKSVGYVYKVSMIPAIARDLLFVAITGIDLWMIKIGGDLIDSVVKLLEWKKFDFIEFFYTDAFRTLAWLLALWIIMRSFNAIRDYLTEVLRRDYFQKFDDDVFAKIQSVNQQEIEDPRFQEYMNFVPNWSREKVRETFDTFSAVTKNLLTFVSSVLILTSMIGPSAFILLLFGFAEPLFRYIGEQQTKNYRVKNVENMKYVDYIWSQMLSIISFAELKVDGIMKFFRREYQRVNHNYYNGLNHLSMHYQIDTAFWAMIGQILKYGYLVYILIYSINNSISIGRFKAAFDYVSNAYQSSYDLWRSLLLAMDYASYAEKFFEMREYQGFGDVSTGVAVLPKKTPNLKLLNLDFIYPDDIGVKNRKIVENVNLEIKPGEKVALVGGDGSGKSTILKTLCGLYEIKAGDYMVGEYSIRELARGELKRKLSVMFQDFIRYHMTIEKNIVLTQEGDRINRSLYKRAKEASGVDEFMESEKLKDTQMLGKWFAGGKEISPGYWQRIAIARLLYRNKELNVMDEPFTFIDGISRSKIIKGVIDFLGPEKTLIYITKDTDMLKYFDRIYYFVNGKISEQGSYKELIKKKGEFYKEVVANQ